MPSAARPCPGSDWIATCPPRNWPTTSSGTWQTSRCPPPGPVAYEDGTLGTTARQLTVAAAIFLVLTAVVATTALVVTNRARQEANVARADEARAKEEAFGWLREAERLIDVMATGVSSVLQNVGGAQGLRLRLLNEAASAYERFAEVQVDDPDIRLQAGHAQMRLGDIYRLMQTAGKGGRGVRAGANDLHGLVDHPFAKDDPRLDAALCLRKLGDVRLDQGQYDRARQCLAEAQTRLASAKPSPRSRRQDVDLKMSLGWLERECENLEQAEHWLREAERLAALAAADAETPLADQQEGLAQLALAQSTLGDVLSQSGRHPEAIECSAPIPGDGRTSGSSRCPAICPTWKNWPLRNSAWPRP